VYATLLISNMAQAKTSRLSATAPSFCPSYEVYEESSYDTYYGDVDPDPLDMLYDGSLFTAETYLHEQRLQQQTLEQHMLRYQELHQPDLQSELYQHDQQPYQYEQSSQPEQLPVKNRSKKVRGKPPRPLSNGSAVIHKSRGSLSGELGSPSPGSSSVGSSPLVSFSHSSSSPRIGGTRFSVSGRDFSPDLRTFSPGTSMRTGSLSGDVRTSSIHPRSNVGSVTSSPACRFPETFTRTPEHTPSRRKPTRSLSNASDNARQRFAAGPDEESKGFRFPRTHKLQAS